MCAHCKKEFRLCVGALFFCSERMTNAGERFFRSAFGGRLRRDWAVPAAFALSDAFRKEGNRPDGRFSKKGKSPIRNVFRKGGNRPDGRFSKKGKSPIRNAFRKEGNRPDGRFSKRGNRQFGTLFEKGEIANSERFSKRGKSPRRTLFEKGEIANSERFSKREKDETDSARRATGAATFGERCGVFKNNRENVAKMGGEGERR